VYGQENISKRQTWHTNDKTSDEEFVGKNILNNI
jgi:hypothetical protein